MKRMVWIAALAAAVLLTPFHSRDAAKLKPVQALCLDLRDGKCILEADNGLYGLGPDPAQAVADLERTAPGVAVLSTARQLVVTDAAAAYLRPLLELEVLHPGTALYGSEGPVNVEDAADYLNRRGSGVTVTRVQAALLAGETVRLPRLTGGEGRYYIY